MGPNGAGNDHYNSYFDRSFETDIWNGNYIGHDIEHETIAARRSMGIVSENSNVYDDLTAWQNMMFSAELYHVGRKEREKKGKRTT